MLRRRRHGLWCRVLAVLSVLALGCGGRAEARYAGCARAPDPPLCLVQAAAPGCNAAAGELLTAVIFAGALERVKPCSRPLAQAVRDVMGVLPGKVSAAWHVGTAAQGAEPGLLAAIALAAAAQRQADPFAAPLVRELTAAARGSLAIAPVAAMLWMRTDTYHERAADVTQPPGVARIWQAIVDLPPENPDVLLQLAEAAAFSAQARQAGLALLRILVQRTGTTADARAQAASLLARIYGLPEEAQQVLHAAASAPHHDMEDLRAGIAAARLRRGYQGEAARTVMMDALARLDSEGFSPIGEPEDREALEAAGARQELTAQGDAALQRAAQAGLGAEERGRWLALASDGYRQAGQRERAVALARRGLPFVAVAVAARNCPGLPGAACDPAKVDAHQQAVDASGFGTEPVLALYRAGAVQEALSTGFLTGFDRFRNAPLAGEVPDVQWVIDDHF